MSIELECVDDLREEEEEGEGEVYDEAQLLRELKVLGSAVLMSEDWGETELLDNDDGRTKRLRDGWTIFEV